LSTDAHRQQFLLKPGKEFGMKTVEFYENVPDKSTLEVSFGPADGPITGSVLFITSGNVDDETWSDKEVRPGPRKHELERDRAYLLEMRVAFLQDATATINARIRKPDGSTYSTPKVWTIQGKKGKVELRVLIIRMAA
jgi:hypothetical protein